MAAREKPDGRTAERMARPSRRRARRVDFDFFHRHSRELFGRIASDDPRNAFFDTVYAFRVTPGGAMGGLDGRFVEVIYGSRPIDAVTERADSAACGPRLRRRMLAEHGARLTYERMVSLMAGSHKESKRGGS